MCAHAQDTCAVCMCRHVQQNLLFCTILHMISCLFHVRTRTWHMFRVRVCACAQEVLHMTITDSYLPKYQRQCHLRIFF